MADSLKTKDIPRHATLLASKAAAKASREAFQVRLDAAQALKDEVAAERSGNTNQPLTPAQRDKLLDAQAIIDGLLDP